MFCTKCGNEVFAEEKFCTNCGMAIVALEEDAMPHPVAEVNLDSNSGATGSSTPQIDDAAGMKDGQKFDGGGGPGQNFERSEKFANTSDAPPAPLPEPFVANGESNDHTALPHASAAPNVQYSEKDLLWTAKQVLLGKPMVVLAVSVGVWVALIAIGVIGELLSGEVAREDALAVFQQLTYMFAEFTLAKNNTNLAIYLFLACALLVPLIVETGIPVLFVVKFFLNRRARRTIPTAEAVAAHREETQFKWRLSYSIAVGIVDYLGTFMLLCFCVCFISSAIQVEVDVADNAILAFLLPIVAITITEWRIRRLTRFLITTRNKNRDMADEVRRGMHLEKVPDSFKDEISVAKIARLVGLGICSSPAGAVLWLRIINVRSRIMQNASFLGSALTAIATFITFGLLSIVITETGNVTAAFASGTYSPDTGLVAIDARRSVKKPKLYYEIGCVLVTIVFSLYFIALLQPQAYDLNTEEGYANAAVGVWSIQADNGQYYLELSSTGAWDGRFSQRIPYKQASQYVGGTGLWQIKRDSAGRLCVYVDAGDMDGGVFQGAYYLVTSGNQIMLSQASGERVYTRSTASG